MKKPGTGTGLQKERLKLLVKAIPFAFYYGPPCFTEIAWKWNYDCCIIIRSYQASTDDEGQG